MPEQRQRSAPSWWWGLMFCVLLLVGFVMWLTLSSQFNRNPGAAGVAPTQNPAGGRP